MLELSKYKSIVKEVGDVVNIEGMSIADLISINAEVLTAYLTAQCHDKQEITCNLEEFKKQVIDIVTITYSHQLDFLKQDMEKYSANSV